MQETQGLGDGLLRGSLLVRERGVSPNKFRDWLTRRLGSLLLRMS